MTIRWYPGHMVKALEQIGELIKKIDVVIEVIDARLPFSSSNHQLESIRRTKPWVKVLNKQDLADPVLTKKWITMFEKTPGIRAIALNSKNTVETKKLIKICQQSAPKRGKPGFPVRIMVVGIPNVGKSTLINTLAGKCMAKVGDKPAVTTTTQQIDLHNGVVLSDTPGILWPNMDNQDCSYRLAVSGAIGANAMDYETVAIYAGDYLLQTYPKLILNRLSLTKLPEDTYKFLICYGKQLGCLKSGGEVNMNRAAESLLRELRNGKLGRISLEKPDLESINK